MTISTTDSVTPIFTGNDVATTFPFTNFKINSNADLGVYYVDSAGTETLLVEGVGYSLTLNSDQDASPGGTITYPISGSPLTIGDKLFGKRAVQQIQTMDLANQSTYNPEVVEDSIDKVVQQIQQVQEEVDRSLKVTIGSEDDSDALITSINLSEYNAAASANSASTSESNASDSAAAALVSENNAASTLANAIQQTSSTGSAIMPIGTTAERDGTPVAGYLRHNSDYGRAEEYDGANWKGLGGAGGAGGDSVFYENDQTVDNDYTITTNKNAMSAGAITIATGVTVTVPTGSTWTVV